MCWDPDPNDTTYVVDYVYALREGTQTRVVHDRHIEGLFQSSDLAEDARVSRIS